MPGRDHKQERAKAAGFFVARASEAMEAAETARSEEQAAALFKEAETWLYMASHCLSPSKAQRPETLGAPFRRAAGERRSFGREE